MGNSTRVAEPSLVEDILAVLAVLIGRCLRLSENGVRFGDDGIGIRHRRGGRWCIIRRIRRSPIFSGTKLDVITLGLIEFGENDEPLFGREFGMARSESQRGNRRIHCVHHPGVLGRDDLLTCDEIGESPSDEIGDDDAVTDGEFIELSKGFAVRRAVAGDSGISELTGKRRVRVVTRSFLQIGCLHSGNDVLGHTDGGYLDDSDRIAIGQFDWRSRFIGFGGLPAHGDCRVRKIAEGVLESLLGLRRFDSRSPQLLTDEQEDEES